MDLTKNLKYDRLTTIIFKKVLISDSNCIDVGCHKGEMLDLMLKYAPKGKHFGFEPIPSFFEKLEEKYNGNTKMYSCALSETKGETTFQFVKNAPAYSGIKKRKYDVKNPEIEEIKVKLEKLDNLIEDAFKVDLIKIDVEGAELGVLKGAKETIKKNRPVIVFEFGKGASEFYGTKPEDIYSFLVDECGLRIFNLHDWIKGNKSLSLDDLSKTYHESLEYYFIAAK